MTLVSQNLEALNAIGAGVMLLDQHAWIRLIQSTSGLGALIADRDGSRWMTPGIRARLRD